MKKTISLFLGFCIVSLSSIFTQSYTRYHIGSNTDSLTIAKGGICLMGGASENDEAMKWFLRKANGGDIVVLRTNGSDGYNSYLYTSLGISINSVRTFVCNNRNASFDSSLLTAINQAEAIWFAGGDQSEYVSFWRNTPLDSLINLKVNRDNIAIGGTSAGMAILGSTYFSAQNGTVTSAVSLQNPYDAKVTVDTTRFLSLPFLSNIITDTHYDNPDRKGRHSVFIAKGISQYGLDLKGIACDEYTAACIDTNGIVSIYGGYPTYDDNAYFIQPNCELVNYAPEVFTSGLPFTWNHSGKAMKVYQVKGTNSGRNKFNLTNWKMGVGGVWRNWWVQNGVFFESSSTPINCRNTTIDEKNIRKTTIYPNPFTNQISIESSIHFSKIELTDAAGRVILITEKQFLNTSNLKPGIYYLKIKEFQELKIYKIIKI